jgi:hypothetical protein
MNQAETMMQEVLAAFDFGAPVVGALRFGQGHINDTFVVHTQPEDASCRRFILQRMSAAAFKRPDQLMENILGVTEYLGREIESRGGSREREALRVIRPRNGEPYYTDSAGGAWRVYPFVEDTICYQTAETPELFAASGRAFGHFQRLLQGYPAQTLHETIPHFHDTEDRLAKLKAAMAADKLSRAAECRQELDFVLAREADCSVALQALRDGILPLRVTHNDTKLNNVLMDRETGEGLCVIDLDTVMPGLSINDFGDSIRFGANHSAEDEKDLSRVNLYPGFPGGRGRHADGCGDRLPSLGRQTHDLRVRHPISDGLSGGGYLLPYHPGRSESGPLPHPVQAGKRHGGPLG